MQREFNTVHAFTKKYVSFFFNYSLFDLWNAQSRCILLHGSGGVHKSNITVSFTGFYRSGLPILWQH